MASPYRQEVTHIAKPGYQPRLTLVCGHKLANFAKTPPKSLVCWWCKRHAEKLRRAGVKD